MSLTAEVTQVYATLLIFTFVDFQQMPWIDGTASGVAIALPTMMGDRIFIAEGRRQKAAILKNLIIYKGKRKI